MHMIGYLLSVAMRRWHYDSASAIEQRALARLRRFPREPDLLVYGLRSLVALIIFPEGTRSRTGEMQAFRTGIGALLAGRNVSVLPCYVQGAFRAWPKGRRLPRPAKVRLIVGQPLNYSSRHAAKSELCAIASE